jgi:iron(III) transport system ATP-binding protein
VAGKHPGYRFPEGVAGVTISGLISKYRRREHEHRSASQDEPFDDGLALVCRGISKKFGDVQAVWDVDLEAPRGGIVALLGPSGCGKTTVLRMIAGFETPETGEVLIGGREVCGNGRALGPEKRRVGMVFQEGALFPHLTVEQNVAYGLGKGVTKQARVKQALGLVGLADHRSRMPHQLSGGQQQRVALARALAPQPDILLLDEPFSNLDPSLREQVRADTLEIIRASQVTAVFVTHDQDEALLIGDTVAVMREGSVEQAASPEVIFHQPTSAFVARFIGTADFLPARIEGKNLTTEIGAMDWEGAPPLDAELTVMVRPDCLECRPNEDGPGVIEAREFRGGFNLYRVSLPSGAQVRCLLPHTTEYDVGSRVEVGLRSGHSMRPFVDGRALAR